MSEVRAIIAGATGKSLVLIDEICRGTETAKGTCIAGSIIETLDDIGCLGVVSSHLHGLLTLPLNTKNMVYRAMGTVSIGGETKPTWKLIDGVCKESLAFETAKREGVPEKIIRRAEELYLSLYTQEAVPAENGTKLGDNNFTEPDLSMNRMVTRDELNGKVSTTKVEILEKKVEDAITIICHEKLMSFQKGNALANGVEICCTRVGCRKQPPPSAIGASCVYVMLRPDKKLYVGETDDIEGRVRSHRSKEGLQSAGFIYFTVQGKSLACQLETLLINQLPNHGFQLTNVADGKHKNFGTSNLIADNVTV